VSMLLKRPLKRSADIQLRMLQHRLLSDLTFRLPDRAKNDFLLGFKEWKRVVSRKYSSYEYIMKAPLVLVSTSNQIEIAKEYISANTEHQSLNVLVREELSLPNFSFLFHIFALRISLQCLFNSRRVNLALLLREVVEWSAVESVLFKSNTSDFFDFTPFEKDSNALAYCLMKKGIHVTKIPSSGPLSGHHTFMIADEIVLSSAYQLEELSHLKHVYVKAFLKWPPEQYMRYASHYESAAQPSINTIGFYSHGEWVRKKAGHVDIGLGIQENELFIMESLKLFLNNHTEYQLLIFPHPKERLDSNFEFFYTNFFKGTKIKIAPSEMKSSENFYRVNIGLMAYSTILFERLAMGYKCLIGSSSPSNFPLEGSPLKSLCVHDYKSFEKAVILMNEESNQEFFVKRNLEKYPLKEFLKENVALN
jgi:hypothetical protein